MENQENAKENMGRIELNKITWYSKLAAIVFFLGVLPAWAFYIGVQFSTTQSAIQAQTLANMEQIANPAPSAPSQNSTTTTGTVPGCSPSAVTTTGSQEKSYDLAQDTPLTFKISYTETKDPVCGDSYAFNTIQVIKNGATIQTLQVGDNQGSIGNPISDIDSYFEVQDMNFDGYKDIGLLAGAGATGNATYYYWLYNPHTGMFALNNDLSQMTSPTPNTSLKQIDTFSDGGDAGLIYDADTYTYENGNYLLIKSVSEDEATAGDGTKFRKVVKELENGKMVTTSDTVLTADQAEASAQQN